MNLVKGLLLPFLLIFLVSCSSFKPKSKAKIDDMEKWVGTWATAPQLVEPHNLPPEPGLSNNSLRQIVRVSIGGSKIRLRLSNRYSKDSLLVNAVSIAVAAEKSQVVPGSIKELTFNGQLGFSIAPGTDIYSDPLGFDLVAGSLLAVTIYYGETTASLTGHPGSRTTSYLLTGDQTQNVAYQNPITTDHWYSIMNVDVQTNEPSAAIAILGNSITDGRGSGTNRQNRWPDILSQRLLSNTSTANLSVLNLGIGGNCVLRGGLGPTALERFDYDILNQSGVKWLIILEGINDIGGIRKAEDAPIIAQELINAYKYMIERAHANGIKVYGATILPFAKSFYDEPYRQEARTIVNNWIRTSGTFDAIIDFDQLMESDEAGVILPDMHDNDFLHPNEAGYRKMGEWVDLRLFENS